MNDHEKQFEIDRKEINPDDKIQRDFESQGWQRVGNEVTHIFPLDSETCRFLPKEVKTEQAIEDAYLRRFKSGGFTEVKLVRRHTWKDKLGYVEDPHSFDVYLRRPQDKK